MYIIYRFSGDNNKLLGQLFFHIRADIGFAMIRHKEKTVNSLDYYRVNFEFLSIDLDNEKRCENESEQVTYVPRQ